MNLKSQIRLDPKTVAENAKSKYKESEFVDRVLLIGETSPSEAGTRRMLCKLFVYLISIIIIFIIVNLLLPVLSHSSSTSESVRSPTPCLDTCRVQLVESIPEGLVYNSTVSHPSTFSAWTTLIGLARETVQLAGMYWTLRGKDVYEDPSDWQGENIFSLLKQATKLRQLKLQIAQNEPRPGEPNKDTEELAADVGAEVRNLNFRRLMGNGILHTKLWLVDRKHFYVGSANFDWRSLTQVKEMGVLVTDCSCLAGDIGKIFDVYWSLGQKDSVIPDSWPDTLATDINSQSRLDLTKPDLSVYLSSSPPPFCPKGREVDVDAILHVIDNAKQFINIAVMDYFPTTLYTKDRLFWPVIDDRIRKAAIERGVKVRMLISHWAHTRPNIRQYLSSLTALNGAYHNTNISVKMFSVPAFTPDQAKIPFARVNHNKYMVTDEDGYIGTSNWSADYFINTGGIGLVFRPGEGGKEDLRKQLAEVFDRDWESSYSQLLENVKFEEKQEL